MSIVDKRALTTTLAHPQHFDASKFGPNGEVLGRVNIKGRKAKLRPDEAEQIAFLEKIVRTAKRDLVDYLVEKGYSSKATQGIIIEKIRKGWRPSR